MTPPIAQAESHLDRPAGIGRHVGVAFAALLALMFAMTLAGLRNGRQANAQLQFIAENRNVKVELAQTMLSALRERALSMHAVSLLVDPFDVDEEFHRFHAHGGAYRHAREQLEAMPLGAEEARLLALIRQLTRDAQPVVEEVVRLAGAQPRMQQELLHKIRDEALPRQRRISEQVDELIALQRRLTEQAVAQADATSREVSHLLAALGSLALLVGLVIAVYVGRRVGAQAQLLHRLALSDALTQLPNRSQLQVELARAVARCRRQGQSFGVLLMDLDGFKRVNDTLGHEVGDRLLCEVGRRLQSIVRPGDLVARLGGDEFVAVLHDIQPDSVTQVAEKILACLDRAVVLDEQSIDVGASGGLAVFPWHGSDAGTLLRQADIAMYVAKREASRLAMYSPDQERLSRGDLSLKSELLAAIENDQLELHYQPKIDLAAGHVVGVEALVRWNHPRRGRMPPDHFIPMAEQTGIITPLTRWVIRTALQQIAAWSRLGHELSVSVNLSARDMLDSGVPGHIAHCLDATGLAPSRLTLELTESAVMSHPTEARRLLAELDAMGVSLSIDDFGTGYSSLARLKQMRVDEIKIDRSFVKDMVDSENDAVIVRAIVELGHNLGLSVVAEGVEDALAHRLLCTLGCDAAQGYHMARPLPAGELSHWLEGSSWSRRKPTPKAAAVASAPAAIEVD